MSQVRYLSIAGGSYLLYFNFNFNVTDGFRTATGSKISGLKPPRARACNFGARVAIEPED